MRVLIVGCGYVGLPLGRQLVTLGHQVTGLRRSPEADHELHSSGITPLHADITDPSSLTRIAPSFNWIINLVSSTRGGVDEYEQVYLRGTENLLAWLQPANPQRFLYTSSTSVYAQTDSSLVDESSPANPSSPTSAVLIQTEKLLHSLPIATVLRVAGIYGPDRGHLFHQFLRGAAKIHGKGDRLLNMIHLHDLVQAIITALEAPSFSPCYNVADDEPVTERDFFTWLAHQTGKPMPPSVSADELKNRKRGFTSKRVSNRKLKEELHFQFKFSTFRQGYRAELDRLSLLAPH